MALSFGSISVDEIDLPVVKEKNIRVDILRLDKIHPIVSGNKWFKLNYYLKEAGAEGKQHILTWGGAYSNHLVATAAAGKLLDFKTTGIVRGERPATLSHTLLQAMGYGMELFFMSRDEYRNKVLPAAVNDHKDAFYFINEGGYGENGVLGASKIVNYCSQEKYSHIACAVGTSATMAGLIKAALPHQEIIGISVLKNNKALEKDLRSLLAHEDKQKKFHLIHTYHFGGYARQTRELISFMNDLYKNTLIPSDFVYTGKLFYAIIDRIKKDLFPRGSHLLLLHSGGLQGNLSLPLRTLIF